MRPINEIADDCLRLMKPHQNYSNYEWWENIIKNGEAPRKGTVKYYQWMQERSRTKDAANKYFERKRLPERLMFVGHGDGIYLVDEEDVIEITTDQRARKVLNVFKKGSEVMKGFIACERLSTEDRELAQDMKGFFNLTANSILGTMLRMKSLPESTKKTISKRLGIKLPRVKKNKTKKIRQKIKECKASRSELLKKIGPVKANQIIKKQVDAAKYASVNNRTIRRWVQEGKMPLTKEGYYIKKVLKIFKKTSIKAA